MIDSENLRTASLYINNQLLSRGLLRDGRTIDFTNPGHGEGELAATMGRVIGVVNDLILRRDRDAEQRENLSTTVRTLRAETLRQANDVQRLQDKCAEAQRRAQLGEAAEAAARAQLRMSEAQIARLRGDAARQRQLVAQTRTLCATEVRRRDRQIDGLKKAVVEAGRARGTGRHNLAVTSISVVGGVGMDDEGGHGRTGMSAGAGAGAGTAVHATSQEGYDLRMETNAFLAELARGLSEENDTLLDLVRRTTQRLREMSGWGEKTAGRGGPAQAGGAPAADASGAVTAAPANSQKRPREPQPAVALPTDCLELSNDIDTTLEHLRTILTNPSFVPIEEVVVREDEIHRLRDGWEKMEGRWREAVHLIDGWRRRMQGSGRPVNVEELKMGLRLSPVKVRDIDETAHGLGLRLEAVQEEEEEEEEGEDAKGPLKARITCDHESRREQQASPSPATSLHLVPAPPEYDDVDPDDEDASDSEASSTYQDEDIGVSQLDVEEPNIEIIEQSAMFDSLNSPPLPVPPQLGPLRDSGSAGNRRGGIACRQSDSIDIPNYHNCGVGEFTTRVEESTWDLRKVEREEAKAAPVPPPHATRDRPSSSKPSLPSLRSVPAEEATDEKHATGLLAPAELTASHSSLDSILLGKHHDEPAASSKISTASTKASERGPVPKHTRTTDREVAPSSSKNSSKLNVSRPGPRGAPSTKLRPRRVGELDDDNGMVSTTNPSTTTRTGKPSVCTISAASSANSASTPVDARSRGHVLGLTTASTTSTATTNTNTTLATSASAANKSVSSVASASTNTDSSSGGMPPPPTPITTAASQRSPRRNANANSRLPLPRTAGGGSNSTSNGLLPPPQQSPLSMATIAAKLAASEREADAARVRAKLRAARLGGGGGGRAGSGGARGATAGSAQSDGAPEAQPWAASGLDESSKRERDITTAAPRRPDSRSTGKPGPIRDGEMDDREEREESHEGEEDVAAEEGRRRGQKRQKKEQQREHHRQQQPQQEKSNDDIDLDDEPACPVPLPSVRKRQRQQVPNSRGQQQHRSRKRERRTSKVASRRRSTLNPRELETLIQGSAAVASPLPGAK